MIKRILITLALLLFLLGPVTGLKVFQIRSMIAFGGEMAANGMPPTAVATARAENQSWTNTLRAAGTLRPVQGVTLAVEIPGRVIELAVENGARVAVGDVLLRLDTSTEEARLASALAAERLASINLERARGLLANATISQAEFDVAEATFRQADAELDNIRAVIAKKTIRAPFSGRVGIRLVNLGQNLREGDLVIPLQSLDPIFVEFNISQQRLASLAVDQVVRIEAAGVEGPVEGRITAINPVLDEVSRTVRVQATVPNPEERLRAGMFADVVVTLPETQAVVAIPLTSVVQASYGASVFVVEEGPDGLIGRKQFVSLGSRRGDFVAVTKGLEPGARVVSAGAFKLQPNASLMIDDTMQPTPSLTPQPDNS